MLIWQPSVAAPETMPRGSLVSRLTRRAMREARSIFGLPSFLKTEDRRVLERVIVPSILSDCDCRDILFVGCQWFTKGYEAWFCEKNYATIDIDPTARKFGARRHIVDGLENIERHFQPASLDLIIANGVFGWGLDTQASVERAISGSYGTLRPGGLLIIGVDDVEEHRPYALENCEALTRFEPYVFPVLQTADYLTDTSYRHRFLFFRRPGDIKGIA